ncbi:unnamed protein product [Orchesella dallaii]|uniref:Uncharacterized protein n=1 Tax=Orchesella dallaii TaxID=48710 RepID=A0ABP1PTJ6_9HEXA
MELPQQFSVRRSSWKPGGFPAHYHCTTHISTSSLHTASSIFSYILTVAVSGLSGVALTLLILIKTLNARAMQQRATLSSAIPAYGELEDAQARGDITVD